MVELRRTTRDVVGSDGSPVIGRGYEVRDDAGEALDADRLSPAAFTDIAVVEALPSSGEERETLKTAPFGVGRTVLLRSEEAGVVLLDEAGAVRAGRVDSAVAEATAQLLRREDALVTWVCWEWLREGGRSGVHVALSRPELAPRRLSPPTERASARALLADRRVWLALAAVVVVILVGFAACG